MFLWRKGRDIRPMRTVWFKSLALTAFIPLIALTAVFAVCSASASAQSKPLLTQVEQVIALTNAQAAQAFPVRMEATITFLEPQDSGIFVESNGHGVYLEFDKDLGLRPGDRVLVTGVTRASFRPEVKATNVQFLAHGHLPVPQPANFEDLIQSKFDSQYVTVRGHVLAASADLEAPIPGLRLEMAVPHGIVSARIARPGTLKPADLLETEIQVTGVAGGEFDSRMQMAGVWVDAYSPSDIVVLQRPAINPWDQPTVPMDRVIDAYRTGNESLRVKIAGTLTYYEPGALAVIERGGLGMRVDTYNTKTLHLGESVEATGFPEIVSENVRLGYGQLRRSSQKTQLSPQSVLWEDASAGKYAYNLISMEGEVMGTVHDSSVDLVIIRADGHLFSATLRHDSSDASTGSTQTLPPMGSRVRVVGVCFMDTGNHWRDRLWFDLRMRSLNDITILQQPYWWTTKRLAYMTTGLSAAILMAVIWVGLLDRRLRSQTATWTRQSEEDAMRERRLARQEQQRSRILELISSSEPLPEVLREIQSMVSSRLFGASCWFELNAVDGTRAGVNRPSTPDIVCEELFSQEGASLGLLLAMPLRTSANYPEISVALTAGARLAELAIDTRRLYSDLRHRSEHDLLTDIPNRFSMEKHLDRLMLRATRNEGLFGLIYVDLDKFKQINDRYGHRTGDLYLQEVTRRMKLQLRTDDVLARIGGDEFIALVPILRSHADAEEIAMRLERCFDDPFELDGYTLLGSASVGLAVYPEDGTTKEGLQRSADAAMYAHKETRKRQEKLTEAMQRVWNEDVQL
jgi:diguanylate cyclase (GGDEF)-like protein